MRNPFKRQPRPAGKPSLRERLAATREKCARTLRVHRALSDPLPQPEPPVDRAALVNYATFLAWERMRVCAELYPHLGARAANFVLGRNAAERFFYPDGTDNSLSRAWRDVPAASTRAVAVLDLVGVDWRSDLQGDGIERSNGRRDLLDTGERPVVPYGWPAVDAGLVTAVGDLHRLDAAIKALIVGDERRAEDVPGYVALEDARDEALDTLERERAESLLGLQAKARAIQTRIVSEDLERTGGLSASLARDLLGIDASAIEPRSDPIFAAVEEAWRLTRECGCLHALCADKPDTHPSWKPARAAHVAMWEHVRVVLLETVPTTAAGCVALARFAIAFTEDQGVPTGSEGNDAVLALIARSSLL